MAALPKGASQTREEKRSKTSQSAVRRNKLETEGFQFERRSSAVGDDGSFMNRQASEAKLLKLPKSASEAHFLGKRSKPEAGETFLLAGKRTSEGICDEVKLERA